MEIKFRHVIVEWALQLAMFFGTATLAEGQFVASSKSLDFTLLLPVFWISEAIEQLEVTLVLVVGTRTEAEHTVDLWSWLRSVRRRSARLGCCPWGNDDGISS